MAEEATKTDGQGTVVVGEIVVIELDGEPAGPRGAVEVLSQDAGECRLRVPSPLDRDLGRDVRFLLITPSRPEGSCFSVSGFGAGTAEHSLLTARAVRGGPHESRTMVFMRDSTRREKRLRRNQGHLVLAAVLMGVSLLFCAMRLVDWWRARQAQMQAQVKVRMARQQGEPGKDGFDPLLDDDLKRQVLKEYKSGKLGAKDMDLLRQEHQRLLKERAAQLEP